MKGRDREWNGMRRGKGKVGKDGETKTGCK